MTPHRMLVVEDHVATRRALHGVFTGMGWHVSVAGTVAEGLALLESEPEPCCMILDIDLPDGFGDQVLKRVREMDLKTRVVVSSGTMDTARLKDMVALHPDAFLTKPITLEAVWDDICRVCRCD